VHRVLHHHGRVLRRTERIRSFDPIAIADAIDTAREWPTGWPLAAIVGPTLGHAGPPVGRFGPPVGHPARTLVERRKTG
jgi:hypothetical protein